MKLSRAVALVAHPISLAFASAATVALARHRSRMAAQLLVALPTSVFASKLLKRAFPRRKPRLLTLTPRESFPSGHATGTTAFATSLAVASGSWRAAPLALAAAVFVDACRYHDREHRIGELVTGNAIGLAGATLGGLVTRMFAAHHVVE
jgi:membrane-associated phospholipid phosphatase